MSGYKLILIAGPKHSAGNAAKIRDWKADAELLPEAFRGLVDDWRKRGFLNADDARQLVSE